MGFWHTGYMEFHEPSGLDISFDPRPKIYYCKYCNATFPSYELLRVHLFEGHPHDRPQLFLKENEIGTTPAKINQSLNAKDVSVNNCNKAWINGTRVSIKKLKEKISEIYNDTITIRLANKDVYADFNLQFNIASIADLEGVENCFFAVAKRGRLDRREIENFIETARLYPTAINYCDGVCEYFYGILIKERSLESSLPYEKYREKLNKSNDSLKDFERPLALAICSLIRFNFNHFWSYDFQKNEKTIFNRVDLVSWRFSYWISGNNLAAEKVLSLQYNDNFEKNFTDFETEKILQWGIIPLEKLVKHIDDIESMMRLSSAEYDRTKLRILLSEIHAFVGNFSEARYYARELRNNQDFGLWSEKFLTRLSQKEQK